MFEHLKLTLRDLIDKVIEGFDGWELVYAPWTVLSDNSDGSIEIIDGEHPEIDKTLVLVLQDTEVQEAIRLVTEAIRTNAELVSRIDAFHPIDPSIDHKGWVGLAREVIIWPFLMSYFRKVGAVQTSIEDFESTFQRLAEDIQADTYLVTELSPITNIELAEERIEISPGLIIRRLSNSEKEQWVNESLIFKTQPLRFSEILRLNCAIELKYSNNRTDSKFIIPRNFHEASRLSSAIRLYSNNQVEIAFTTIFSDSFWPPIGGTTSNSSRLEIDDKLLLDEASCAEVANLFHRLESSSNAKVVALPMRRWDNAFNRIGHEDRLIDYWVALESLFAPDSIQEIKFRGSLRIAAFVGVDSNERTAIYKQMRDSYDLRSSLVHGHAVSVQKLKTSSDEARGYLRRALLKVIDSSVLFDPVSIESGLLEK